MNRYDALLRTADDEGTRARLALRFGAEANADQAAREQALAKRFGLPPDAVRLDPKAFQVRAQLEDSEPALKAAPKLRGWLSENPARAEVSHQDVGALSAVEQAVGSFLRGSATLGMGATVGVGKSIFDVAGFLYDMVGADEKSAAMRAAANRAEEAMDAYGLQPGDNPTLKGIKSGLQSAGTNLALLPLGIELAASRGVVAASQGVAGLMGLFTGAGAYNEARDQGKGKVASLAYGVPQGAFEYAFEVMPAAKLFGDLAAGTGFWKTLWHQAKVEGWTEQLTTLAQDFNTWMNLHPDKTVAEFIAERPGAAYETLIATIVGAGVQTGGAKALHRVAGRGQRRDDEAAQAERHAQFLSEVAKTAEAIPTRERSPEDFQTFAQSLMDDDVPALHFDAQVLLQSGVTSQELAKVSAAAAAALDEAAATGGSVSIPSGEFLTNAPGSTVLATLVEHARTAPDAMSAAEAKTWMAERGDALQSEMSDALAEKQGDQAFKDSQEAVRQTVLGELQAIGRAQAPVNEAYATLVAARTAVRAAQLGLTPEALFEKQRLRVRGSEGQGGAVLEQGTTLDDLRQQWADAGIKAAVAEKGGIITLSQIVVPEGERGSGKGTAAMQALLDYADRTGQHVALSPSADFGGNKGRLVKFYKRFGFVENKGKGRAFTTSESMVRRAAGKVLLQSAWRRTRDAVLARLRTVYAKPVTVSAGNGDKIIVAYAGLKHALNNGVPSPQETALALHIQEAIRAAEFGEQMPDKKGRRDPYAVTTYVTHAQFDGVPHKVTIFVRNHTDGNRYYDHATAEIESPPGLPESSATSEEGDAEPTPPFGGLKLSLGEVQSIVNEVGGTLNQFAGPQAATADTHALDAAQQRLAAGEDAEVVRKATGWHKGADGKWRFEISDKDAKLKPALASLDAGDHAARAIESVTWRRNADGTFDLTLNPPNPQRLSDFVQLRGVSSAVLDAVLPEDAKQAIEQGQGAEDFIGNLEDARRVPARFDFEGFNALPLDEALDHPALFAAYPALRQVFVQVDPKLGVGGSFSLMEGGEQVIRIGRGQQLQTLLHEIQHGIQHIEGFASGGMARQFAVSRGSTPEQVVQTISEAKRLYDEFRAEVGEFGNASPEWADASDQTRQEFMSRAAGSLYERLAGEVEARNTQARADMSAADRVATPPEQTADVRASDVIVVFNGREMDSAPPPANAVPSVAQGARATFEPATNTITLLNGADLSSFLHEAGHYFFENDIALAAEIVRSQREGASITPGEQALLDDVQAMMRWHGFQGGIDQQLREWYSLTFDQQREAHERTAESFEAYLFSGKAPSLELQRPFQQFRAWLLNVYKSLKDFLTKHPEAGKLDDEVRGVFDRMLATTEAIQEAEAARAMGPLFRAADGKMMDAQQWAAYNDLGMAATQEGIEQLQARGLKDMKWLANARGKALRELQAQAKAARDQVRIEVRAEVMSRPIYRAWQFLTAKPPKETDQGGDKAPATPKDKPGRALDASRDSILVAIAKLGGISRDSALRDLSVTAEDFATPSGVFGAPIFRKTGGKSVDDMREALQEWGYLREFDEFGRTEIRELDDLVSAELRGQPQYSAHYDYGRDSAPIEPLPESVLYGRLDTDALRQRYGSGENAVWRKLSARRMTAANGVHPDVVAETFGLESGDAMVQELADATPPAEVIEALTDQRMLERHADLATPQALEDGVNAAVHTRLRERMLATELAALQRATSVREGRPGQRATVDVLAAAARDYAEQMVAAMKAGDLSPARFEAAAARAGRDAAKAFKAGDIAATAAAKRNQLIQVAAARAVREERDQVQRTLRYFKRFDKASKGLDSGFHDQIDALLDKFDLSSSERKSARTTSLRNWVLQRIQDGEAPPIAETLLSPSERQQYLAEVQERNADGDLVNDDERALELLAGAIDRSARRPWRGVTVEELRGLLDTVKALEHQGRLKKRLLSNREQASYEAARDEMADAVRKHGGAGDRNTPTRTDVLGRALAGLKHFGAQHIKAATWARIMDGADGGPVWRYLIRPANTAASRETTMRAEATAALDEILRPILKRVPALDKIGQGRHFATLGRSLNWQERFAIALNTGNESNLQRLMDGSGWSMPKLMPVLQSLSADEWRAVQAVWDHFETYRPQIAEKERRINGREPDWILTRSLQVNTSDGKTLTLRGGYYPVKFDPRVHLKASQHAAAEEASTLLKGAYSAATTRRSFTKARVAEVKGRPLLLDLNVLYSGVNDVIHDLSWHEWVLDANKLLRSSQLDEAIRDHYGPEVKQELERWRDDIVAGPAKLHHGIERAAGWARQSVTASALTFNVLSAAMQPLGLANSVARVGVSWVGKGVARYVAAPIASTREAQAKSEWLRNRTRTRFRELNELRNQVQGQTAAKELMGRYGYWMMMRMQLTVDVPTWWAGYEKAVSEGFDEDTSVALADQGVKDSQGGGEEVDQSGIERGPALVKLFTAFYGFMGTTANVTYLTSKTESSRARAAAKIAMVLMVPAVLGALLKDALIPGDDGDDDGLVKKLITEQISFLFGLVAFGREFTQVGKVLLGEGKGQGYSGPAGLRLIPDTVKLGQQAYQGEFDDAFRKAFVNVLGDLTGLPSVQINRTITGAQAIDDDLTDGPLEAVGALTFGFQKPR